MNHANHLTVGLYQRLPMVFVSLGIPFTLAALFPVGIVIAIANDIAIIFGAFASVTAFSVLSIVIAMPISALSFRRNMRWVASCALITTLLLFHLFIGMMLFIILYYTNYFMTLFIALLASESGLSNVLEIVVKIIYYTILVTDVLCLVIFLLSEVIVATQQVFSAAPQRRRFLDFSSIFSLFSLYFRVSPSPHP